MKEEKEQTKIKKSVATGAKKESSGILRSWAWAPGSQAQPRAPFTPNTGGNSPQVPPSLSPNRLGIQNTHIQGLKEQEDSHWNVITVTKKSSSSALESIPTAASIGSKTVSSSSDKKKIHSASCLVILPGFQLSPQIFDPNELFMWILTWRFLYFQSWKMAHRTFT